MRLFGTKRSTLAFHALCFIGTLIALNQTSHADDSNSMTKTAQNAQDIQAKLIPMVQLPLFYNYNQNTQPGQGLTQAQFQFAPMIPVMLEGQTGFILNPIFTDLVNVQNQTTTNQALPLQLASYIAHKADTLLFGVGPFVQMPTANTSSGSQQTGLGASYGFFYRPPHWVIGATGFNAWGIAGNTSAGTANVYYAYPLISYTTDNAWSYTFQSWINGNPTAGKSYNTNQLMLAAGKTFNLGKTTIQWQVGPSYMVTSTPTSPQGWGGYANINVVFLD
jgi:hypothetical protein